MRDENATARPEKTLDFVRQASAAQPGFAAELWAFVRASRKWWLAPIVLMFVLLGVLLLLGGTGAAPFIYTLF